MRALGQLNTNTLLDFSRKAGRDTHRNGDCIYLVDRSELCASPSARDAGASVGPDAGAGAGGLLSWTGLLGIPWKQQYNCRSHTQCY